MRTSRLGFAVAVSAISMAFTGGAVAEEGFYVEVHGGATFLTDSDISIDGGGDADAKFDTGYMAGGAFGHAWEEGFRAELAVDYRHNDIDKVSGNSAGGVSGDVDTWSGMVNVYYQFPLDFPLKPYIGAGLGAAHVSVDAKVSDTKFLDDQDTVFAYQGMAGLTYEINPAVAVGAGYSYFATQDPEFTTKGGTGFDAQYASHNLMLQVRFSTYPTGAF